jgi:hypothetical protein
MRISSKYLALISLLFLLFSCCWQKKNNKNRVEMETPTITEIQNNNWKKDSVGCLRLRTLELADSLIVANNLLGKSTNEFIDIFGKPNEIIEQNHRVLFNYYMMSVCRDDELVEGADKCWVQFDFINDKLVEIPNVYLIE